MVHLKLEISISHLKLEMQSFKYSEESQILIPNLIFEVLVLLQMNTTQWLA